MPDMSPIKNPPFPNPIQAFFQCSAVNPPVFLMPLPARNAAPPLENWMMTGELMSLAACSTALIVEVEVQLKAAEENTN